MKKLLQRKTDVLIIGAGAAGMALALYLKRAKIDFILAEKSTPGGKLNNIANINNILGIKSIDGPSLAFTMFEQISNLGVEILNEEVLEVVDGFVAKTSSTIIKAKIVVFALGLAMNKVNIKNYDKYFLKGISTCAICDGYLYKGKRILVVGNSDIANKEFDYLKSLTDKIYRVDNVNEKIVSFEGKDKLQKVITTKKTYKVDACFFYSKESVDSSLITGLKIKVKKGHILVDSNCETNINNCFAIGDCIDKKAYQVVSAINDALNVSVVVAKKLR